MTPRKTATLLLTLALLFTQSACLKTRSQIKGAGSDNEAADDSASPAKRYELEEIKNEITRVSGKIEEVEHTQRTQNAGELKEYTARLDGRIADLEKNQLLIMAELKEIKDKKTAQAEEAREAAIPTNDLMGQAKKLLAEKKYEEAAEKFKTVLNKNPKPKDAAEAQFGLGEIEYGLKNYKRAIVHYSKVQEVNASSSRAPASLYKIGLAFQKLNMGKESRGFYAELIERYPKSAEAKKARAKVKE